MTAAGGDRPRIVGITQARMGSTRLPGKVLMPAAGAPLLTHHLDRLKRATRLDALVVATSELPADDSVAAHAAACGVAVSRGSETDVLDRFYRAALAHRADIVVRFTSDCPLIDPDLVDGLVDLFLSGGLDFACIDVDRFPRGLDAEITRFATLETAWREADQPFEREHVMPFIWRRPDRFRLGALTGPTPPVGRRWCVDTAEDLELVRRLLETLLPTKPGFGWRDCLDVLSAHPEWADINRDVRQKTVG